MKRNLTLMSRSRRNNKKVVRKRNNRIRMRMNRMRTKNLMIRMNRMNSRSNQTSKMSQMMTSHMRDHSQMKNCLSLDS